MNPARATRFLFGQRWFDRSIPHSHVKHVAGCAEKIDASAVPTYWATRALRATASSAKAQARQDEPKFTPIGRVPDGVEDFAVDYPPDSECLASLSQPAAAHVYAQDESTVLVDGQHR